ncbi:MAG: acetylornithine deacetylase [Sandaracinaceae bacterium]|nr:acetylornithine deacetylase [Sandaracinaceae bacterium]
MRSTMPSMPTLPPHVDILRTLVGTPSVSSPDPSFDQSNRAVVDHLAELCEQLGFRVEVVPLERSPHKANLIATLGPADQPGGLVFSGHTDTVPYDRDQWHTDPFTLTQSDDGALFGLGVADMKGFFPCALHAVRTLGAGALRKPVVLVATADEESTMWGAQQLVSEGRRLGRHAIIGEPTGMRPVRKHKGVMMERVLLEGSAGHSSDPSLGRNAIEGMGRVIEALGRVRTDFAARYHDASFSVPSPTLNLGKVFGGDSPNRICARCELYYDVRPLPGMLPEAIRAELSRAVQEAIVGLGLSAECGALVDGVPPFETPANSPFVHACEEVTGASAIAVMFGTEAPYLTELGMETVVMGPGSISVAHQPDETLRVQDLEHATGLYTQLLARLCSA